VASSAALDIPVEVVEVLYQRPALRNIVEVGLQGGVLQQYWKVLQIVFASSDRPGAGDRPCGSDLSRLSRKNTWKEMVNKVHWWSYGPFIFYRSAIFYVISIYWTHSGLGAGRFTTCESLLRPRINRTNQSTFQSRSYCTKNVCSYFVLCQA
jgi:hypothetical protein